MSMQGSTTDLGRTAATMLEGENLTEAKHEYRNENGDFVTERENVLLVFHHQVPYWIPLQTDALYYVGNFTCSERAQRGRAINDTDRLDEFGVVWSFKDKEPVVAVNHSRRLEDICDWERVVTFPDVDDWPWQDLADYELRNYDGTKAINFFCEEGLFDRLVALMGYENALVSLLAEPEACEDFFTAMEEYKIKLVNYAARYFHPDVFMYTDDIATARGLFMSPDTYRALLKPHQARIIDAIKNAGMIPEQHTCGKCDSVMEDYVELGVESFTPAQACNDLQKIKELYGDRLTLVGGFDSQGPASVPFATEEDLRAEARRIIDEYARGGGLVAGISSGASNPRNTAIIREEFLAYADGFYDKAENRSR